MIPVESLSWGKELIEAVDNNKVVMLHGPWQSGKTTALKYIQARAKALGQKVHFIYMSNSLPVLKQCIELGQSLFTFLAMEIGASYNLKDDQFPPLNSVAKFCTWVESRNQSNILPLLVIEEYHSFIKNCRDHKQYRDEMNALFAYCHDSRKTFQSIICAGTFNIIATQSELVNSEESSIFDNAKIIEATYFDRSQFVSFCKTGYQAKSLGVDDSVINDIHESTAGHPRFSMFFIHKSIELASENSNDLNVVNWIARKRSIYSFELCQLPTLNLMLNSVTSTQSVIKLMLPLVRGNSAKCTNDLHVSYLRANGIARTLTEDSLTISCPLIRDALLQRNYQSNETLSETIVIPYPLPINYALSIILQALPFMDANVIIDPLGNELSDTILQAELYRILQSLFRNQPIRIDSETRLIKDSALRYDIWMKYEDSEYGIYIQSEASSEDLLKSGEILKYTSTCESREMHCVNFLRSEKRVLFPIHIEPHGWEKHTTTSFNVLFVLIEGDVINGFKYRYALNGPTDWVDL